MKITTSSTVVAIKEQVSCDLSDDTVVLHLKSGVYFKLNEVGARIWELLVSPRGFLDLQEIIVSEFEVSAEQCEGDLIKILGELAKHGLVEDG
ncbi:MAG: PqqD family protein [Planctomycetota bacterium]